MDISILLLIVPLIGFAAYALYKLKRDSIKTEAFCTAVKTGANSGGFVYHGTYQYTISGKTYETYDGVGSALKPAKGKSTYVYVNRENYSRIVSQAQANFYYAVIIIGAIAAIGIIIGELQYYL